MNMKVAKVAEVVNAAMSARDERIKDIIDTIRNNPAYYAKVIDVVKDAADACQDFYGFDDVVREEMEPEEDLTDIDFYVVFDESYNISYTNTDVYEFGHDNVKKVLYTEFGIYVNAGCYTTEKAIRAIENAIATYEFLAAQNEALMKAYNFAQ